MEKILSIIIPTYNMEKYLRHCLDSLIIKENMDKLEVLVINDGSKDTSSAIAHEYQDKYPQTFHVIDKENGNYGSCINSGLKEATGKYVKVLDADDSFDTEAFQKSINIMVGLNVDLVIFDYMRVNEDGECTAKNKRSLPEYKQLTINEVLADFEYPLIEMYEVAYKTDNLRSINYHQTEGISYTDQEWIFLPITTAQTCYYIPERVYKYLIGREGQTMTPKALLKCRDQQLKVINVILDEYKELKCADDMRHYLLARIKHLAGNMYNLYLKHNVPFNPDSLIQMDSSLKSASKEIYDELGIRALSNKIRLRYVDIWRKSSKKSIPLSLKFANWLLNTL